MNVAGVLGYLYILGYLFLFALAILWFFMPFAIFGIKDKLNALISEAQKTNEQLADLKSEIAMLKRLDSNDPKQGV